MPLATVKMLWKINFLNAKIRYRAKNPVLVPDGTHFAPLLE